ncbi:MAG TPA: hypothetical protein VL357_01155 [Rariglobus sp.]|nr:hypothetical protein [Rariglobus sp.]
MRFSAIDLRGLRPPLVVVAVLAVAGVVTRPLENPAWQAVRAEQPALRLESIQSALGQGVTVGLLGGFRAIVADFFWIRANVVWSDSNLPATQTLIKLVTAIDPRPQFFWINGANMIAYDMPQWRIIEAGGYKVVSEVEQQRFDREQSAIALRLLKEGLVYNPHSVAIYVCQANIQLNRAKDIAAAAESYHMAALQPGAPYFTERIYGELLKRMGRKRDAYLWLKKIYPALPKPRDLGHFTQYQIETAMADVVLERIRELEKELNIPDGDRVKP